MSDSTAIVTGGGRGIGQAICVRLAQSGTNVAIADLDTAEMAETKRLVEAEGRCALPLETDVSDLESVQNTVETALSEFDEIDILVNNAGIAGPTSPCEEIEQDAWDATMNVNLRGPFLMCREVIPAMKAQDYGRIINIASVTGKKPLLNRTPYAATKMGLIGFTRTLAHEVGEYDINVNAICPGSVDGPRIRGVFEQQAEATGRTYEEVRTEVESQSPRNELVDRKDIANTAVYLCSDEATRITGQDINVSAGKVMY